MKRFVAICFAMVFVAGGAVPQDSKNTNQVKEEQMAAEQQGDAHNPLGLRTVVGCLSKTAGTYVITGGAPGPKQFRIVSGDVSSLKEKLGYTIKVVGIVGRNDALANQNGLYNAGSTTGVGYLTIEAQKISQVYVNCSGIGKEWSGDHN
jgi:hypothetical protein